MVAVSACGGGADGAGARAGLVGVGGGAEGGGGAVDGVEVGRLLGVRHGGIEGWELKGLSRLCAGLALEGVLRGSTQRFDMG